ncbi:unnamed protein product [Brachionus calyciflorus]|uniref:ACB domain-containing protein n=1 Tax=Brachionus calyciflorus TaxID=104777 RepID=A0A814DKJ7_9BILA|nr:unnamed protein product [Brachionus calyciflorus]
MSSLTLEQRFKDLCQIVQSLPKDGEIQQSNEDKLKFYSYFKQATEGPCNISQPSMFKLVERAKWNAWNGLGNMSKEEAMRNYIKEMKRIIAGISSDSDILVRIQTLVQD